MNLKNIEHIGIAVQNLENALNFYQNILGLKFIKREIVETQAVEIAFLKVGESKIELLEPLNEESTIARFLEKNGEGIHHFAILVDSIEDKIKAMQAQGARLIGNKASAGADNMKIIFVHPRSTNGVLLELCEPFAKEE
ncbi:MULTISPECIES: methylmalonyl-CoA epimerase [Halanaerobium]|jgi:methylmalonyl-CoA/ethylmalonyl-CoA epimerase|uniref:Methylmalonyl-CoA epimerase n=1 Tax=Halanaerobium kushneri TaxID=56779 RepID=A0A1N7AAD6_9FIRM|nr:MULTISPECIES: methylmalonyl-CoA epimerase [Halanaerobium]RCW54629.1 methylmalonyl-CoA epimerase [Halanaerobium sp. ST460_2HS_T2]SIR36130.1 methylmalonyl-CoA epimerase [Halanaerobium kushneri]